jgi:AraC-like DNA-binding protein
MTPYVRGGVLEHFAATVAALGGDADALLDAADVAPEILSLPGIFLPYASYMKLMDLAARETDTPHFGLLMARSGNAETLGTLGIIMTQAETVGAAWDTLTQFYRIHDTYGRVRVYRYPDSAMISYALPRYDQPGTRQVCDVAAEITCNIMRRFCGAEFRCTTVNFPYDEPNDTQPYSAIAADSLGFGASAVELHFPAVELRRSLQGVSEELRRTLDDLVVAQRGPETSSARLVEDRVRALLPAGDCTLARVAETLATSPRTLQARLVAEDTSFRQILEGVRREIATYHLRRGDMQLTQLAMVLGYSELSAFSRSFRSWYGISPRRWVKRGDWRI